MFSISFPVDGATPCRQLRQCTEATHPVTLNQCGMAKVHFASSLFSSLSPFLNFTSASLAFLFSLSCEVNVILSRSLLLPHSPVLSLSYQVSASHPPSSRAQNRAAAIFFLLLQSRASLCFKMTRLFRATCLFFLFKSHWLNTLSTARCERNFFLLFFQCC